jgi:protein-S-isoprenylcysteine O-methyltransferase Ste14
MGVDFGTLPNALSYFKLGPLTMNAMSICGDLWSAFFVIWLVWAIGTKRTQTREGFRSRLPYLTFTVAAFFAMFSHEETFGWLRLRILPHDRWIADLGIALTAAGLLFAIWARAYLGRNWSGTVTVKVGHQLIRSGPYRWVRHPIYSGMILALIGTAINRGQLRGFIAVVLLWVGFTMKSRIEECNMTATFDQQYEEYRRTTGGLVPRLRF